MNADAGLYQKHNTHAQSDCKWRFGGGRRHSKQPESFKPGDDLSQMNIGALNNELKQDVLPVCGTKDELVTRLERRMKITSPR